jgi:hypothetical protein
MLRSAVLFIFVRLHEIPNPCRGPLISVMGGASPSKVGFIGKVAGFDFLDQMGRPSVILELCKKWRRTGRHDLKSDSLEGGDALRRLPSRYSCFVWYGLGWHWRQDSTTRWGIGVIATWQGTYGSSLLLLFPSPYLYF